LISDEAVLTASARGRQRAHVDGGSPVVPLCVMVLALLWQPIRQDITPAH